MPRPQSARWQPSKPSWQLGETGWYKTADDSVRVGWKRQNDIMPSPPTNKMPFARHVRQSAEDTSRVLQKNAHDSGYVHSAEDISAILSEQAALEARNAALVQRCDDLETVIRRLWQRGGAGAPSPKKLRDIANAASEAARRERHEAEEARQNAANNLRDALRAKSDAFVSSLFLETANATIEDEKSKMSELNAMGAGELSRRCTGLQQCLEQERMRVQLLTEDLAEASSNKEKALDKVMDQMRELKHEYAEEGRARSKQHSELVTELDAAREEIERLRMTGDHERMAWEQEVKRHEGLLNTSREKAANDAVDLQGQLKKAQSELQESRDEKNDLMAQLSEQRDLYRQLAGDSRDKEVMLTKEMARLNKVVERLGGEAAESRSTMVARMEELSIEKDRSTRELTQKVKTLETEHAAKTKELEETIGRLRMTQQKALANTAGMAGRDRQKLYWESMKNANADTMETTGRESLSWRTDKEKNAFQREIDLEHELMMNGLGQLGDSLGFETASGAGPSA